MQRDLPSPRGITYTGRIISGKRQKKSGAGLVEERWVVDLQV